MYYFLIPLILGFISNLASAFTASYSEKWGKQAGTFVTILFRDIFGIPAWAIGFIIAIKESAGLLYQSSLPGKLAGWIIITVGGIIIIIALITIRLKAAAPSTSNSLVQTGIYSIVRHPIHCGTFFEFVGLFVLWPSLTVGIACLIGTVWILFQSWFEEKDLLKRIPGYQEYRNKVPAFFPCNKKR